MTAEELAAKARLVAFIQAELRKKAIHLFPDTIEAVIDAYGKRVDQGPPF